jgi:hypothetical protein
VSPRHIRGRPSRWHRLDEPEKPAPGPFAPKHGPKGEFREPRPGGTALPYTPELDRMHKVTDESQSIGEFIEWLKGKSGFVVARWTDDERQVRCPECLETFYDESGDQYLVPTFLTTEKLLALYYDIDLDKAEAEKMLILEHIREVHKSGQG